MSNPTDAELRECYEAALKLTKRQCLEALDETIDPHDPSDWLMEKVCADHVYFEHRVTGEEVIIPIRAVLRGVSVQYCPLVRCILRHCATAAPERHYHHASKRSRQE